MKLSSDCKWESSYQQDSFTIQKLQTIEEVHKDGMGSLKEDYEAITTQLSSPLRILWAPKNVNN